MFAEKGAGLLEALGMGIDLADVPQRRARQGQQVLIHLEALFPDDVTVMAADQIVDFRNAAGGRVLDWQDAILDFVALDGDDDVFEMDVIHFEDRHAGKIFFQGLVAEGSLHALVAYADWGRPARAGGYCPPGSGSANPGSPP